MDNEKALLERLEMLGLETEEIAHDRLVSATAALTCLPMYMVANVHAWTEDEQFRIPLLEFPGVEALREAYVIGQQEKYLDLERPHRRTLASLLSHARPCDRVIYEFALDTLELFVESVTPELANVIRAGVAKTVVAVAKASGEGIFGTGRKVSPEERVCIERIATALHLHENPDAEAALAELDVE